MEAELYNFQASIYSLCGSGIAQFQSFKSHTILYAEVEAELRIFKFQYIPCADAELRKFKPKNIQCAEAELQNFKSNYSLCAEAVLQVTYYSVCGISLVSFARIRSARERRAECPCVTAILAVLFSTVPSWRWALLGFF